MLNKKEYEMVNPNNMIEGNKYDVEELLNSGNSKSYKIRKLYKWGFEKASISKMIGCRYQMVREVLLKTLVNGNE